MKRSRRAAAFVVGVVIVGWVIPAWAGGSSALVGTLAAGEKIFWDGERVASNGQRWTYRFRVTESADVLRVAVDVPDRTDLVALDLIAPDGMPRGTQYTHYAFNAEVFASNPPRGIWTVRVRAEDAEGAAFRLRAALLDDLPPEPVREQLPNLRLVPPYEFTFTAPVPGYGPMIGGDYDNQPLEVAGQRPLSCAPDEVVEDRALRCLRFTAGIDNEGEGPLDLVFDLADPAQRMIQRIRLTNGRFKQRVAGRFDFHPAHAHYHYADIWSFRLFRVTEEKREPLSKGRKSGFCPGDQRFADWRQFNQDPIHSYHGDCGLYDFGESPQVGTMALSGGWGDIYRWYRPGNYLDLGLSADGRYVIQGRVDANEWVLETDETDNFGYAYVKVKGNEITLLERGLGKGPWDPDKVVIRDWWKNLGREA